MKAEPTQEWIGRTLDGRYRIERVLGAGGLGTVYLATHLRLDRAVAIKMLHRELLPSVDLRKRFDREVAMLSRLAHPHIVALTDSGVLDDGMGYLVMELLEGRSLEEHLSRSGALDPSEAIEITRQMLLGLTEAHAKGVLHRDLKPANVFLHPLAEGLHVKLLDFGLAKVRNDIASNPGAYPTLTADGTIVGTPTYMAPEQAAARDVTAAADLYSVGIVLFEMLTGRPPFRFDDKLETIRAHLLLPVPELDVVAPELRPTDALRAFVRRALIKDHAQRFPDARTMLRELDALPKPAATLAEGAAGERARAASSIAAQPKGTEETISLGSVELEAVGPSAADGPPASKAAAPRAQPPARGASPRPVLFAVAGIFFGFVLVVAVSSFFHAGEEHEIAEPAPPPSSDAVPSGEGVADGVAVADGVSPFSGRDLPDELRAARRDVLRGHGLSDAEARDVETYRRAHPTDARPVLLLARSERFHSAWSAMVDRYVDAYAIDASTIGFAPVLADLVRAVEEPSSSSPASDAIVRMFGQSALPTVDARLGELPEGPEHERLAQLRIRLATP